MIYNNGSEFKLHFRDLCKTNDVKHKPTSIKNPQANAILEHIHAVFTNMLRTAKLDMAEPVNASDIDIFLADAAWAIQYTHVISRLDMYRTKVLMYRTMVLMVCPTKVRCLTCEGARLLSQL